MQWCAWSDSRVESVQVLQVRQHLEEALAVAVHFSDRTVEEVEVAQVGQRALRMARQARQQRIGTQGARPSQLPSSQPRAPLRGLQPGRGGAHQRVEVIERGKLVAGEAEALELEERGVLQTIQPL